MTAGDERTPPGTPVGSPPRTPDEIRSMLKAHHNEAERAREKEKNTMRSSSTAVVDMKAIREDRSDTMSSMSSHRELKTKGEVPAFDVRDRLRTTLRPSSMMASMTAPPLRRDFGGGHTSTDKVITETLRNSIGGMRALFQGPGDKALETWGQVSSPAQYLRTCCTEESVGGRSALERAPSC